MNKEQLKLKVDVLQVNVESKQEELTEVKRELNVALNELANAGKPKLSADRASDLVDLLQGMFHDILNDYDTSSLDPEFSIGYDNRIELDCLDMSSIEVHSADIETVLEEIFCIVADEESDNS
tara:strand:- start:115 stop:483 length:369 start_codon:yes stop_codon:yes gene_type:complete